MGFNHENFDKVEFWGSLGKDLAVNDVLLALTKALDGNAHGDAVVISSGKGDQATHEGNFFIPKPTVKVFLAVIEERKAELDAKTEAVKLIDVKCRNLRDRHHEDAKAIEELKATLEAKNAVIATQCRHFVERKEHVDRLEAKLAEHDDFGQISRFAECQRERDLARAKVDELQKTLDAFRDQKENMLKGWNSTLDERNAALAKIADLEAEAKVAKDHRRHLESRLHEAGTGEMKRKIDNLQKRRDDVEAERNEARSRCGELDALNSELQRECRKLEEEAKKGKDDAGFWKGQAGELWSVVHGDHGKIEVLTKSLAEAREQIAYWEKAWKETLGEGADKVGEMRKEIEGLKAELAKVYGQRADALNGLCQRSIDLQSMTKQRDEAEKKAAEAERRFKRARHKLDMVDDVCNGYFRPEASEQEADS